MHEISIGIDPGKSGAISIFRDGVHSYIFIPTIGKEYDYRAISTLFKYYIGQDVYVVLEGVNCDPSWGAKVNWSLGGCMSMFKQVLTDFDIPHTLTNPRVWQKEMWEGVPIQKKISSTGKTLINDAKLTSIIAAQRLFPKIDFKVTSLGNKSKNFNDNLVDATLIAEYCRRKF